MESGIDYITEVIYLEVFIVM